MGKEKNLIFRPAVSPPEYSEVHGRGFFMKGRGYPWKPKKRTRKDAGARFYARVCLGQSIECSRLLCLELEAQVSEHSNSLFPANPISALRW